MKLKIEKEEHDKREVSDYRSLAAENICIILLEVLEENYKY